MSELDPYIYRLRVLTIQTLTNSIANVGEQDGLPINKKESIDECLETILDLLDDKLEMFLASNLTEEKKNTFIAFYKKVLNEGTDAMETQFCDEIYKILTKKTKEHFEKIKQLKDALREQNREQYDEQKKIYDREFKTLQSDFETLDEEMNILYREYYISDE